MVTAWALLVSSRVSLTLMVGRRRCCFWVRVRVREVFGLLVLGGRSRKWRGMSLVGLPRALPQVLGVAVV